MYKRFRLKALNEKKEETKTTHPLKLIGLAVILCSILLLQGLLYQEDEIKSNIVPVAPIGGIAEATGNLPPEPYVYEPPPRLERGALEPLNRDLERIQVGEIYWSATKPYVRINHQLRTEGDTLEIEGGIYTVLKINRNEVFVKDPDELVLKFESSNNFGISSATMEERRNNLRGNLPED